MKECDIFRGSKHIQTLLTGLCLPGGHVLVTEFRGMALNGAMCADVLRPLDLVPSLTLTTNTSDNNNNNNNKPRPIFIVLSS